MNASRILGALAGAALGSRGLGGGVGGGLAGGLLGGMLGGRRRGGLAMAALPAIAAMAYRAWQNRSGAGATAGDAQPDEAELRRAGFLPSKGMAPGAEADPALLVAESMIYAARADGAVDASEGAEIRERLQAAGLDADERAFLEHAFRRPVDLNAFCARIGSPQVAMEVYAAAYAVVDPPSTAERAHLDMLAARLGLSDRTVQAIEAEVDAAAGGPGRAA